MDETNIQEISPDVVPDVVGDDSTYMLDDNLLMDSGSNGDSELMEHEDNIESGYSETVSMGDSTSYILTYSEEQQQADSDLIGGIDKLNETCTLILFFLLFAWVDKKVRFYMKGFGNGKSD